MVKRVFLEVVIAVLFAVAAVSLVTSGVLAVRYISLVSGEKEGENEVVDSGEEEPKEDESKEEPEEEEIEKEDPSVAETQEVIPSPASEPVTSGNCTAGYGKLTLINANFTVDMNYIYTRRSQLVDLTATYGINELNSYNGVPLLDPEAAPHPNEMIKAYETENPGHEMKTVSCFRMYGTSCGRLCAATGTSEHHSGYTCDLIDSAYGTSLDTDYYENHLEWQWLKANSYKYGFIDRYPIEWAGGTMAQPLNVNENGTTGYYETWHYRYVGVPAATEIATGKYNSGKYDSLEHYLKATGYVKDLRAGTCK